MFLAPLLSEGAGNQLPPSNYLVYIHYSMQYKHIQLYDTQDVAELYIRFKDTERAGLRRRRPGGEETRGGAAPLRLPGVALHCRAWFILLEPSRQSRTSRDTQRAGLRRRRPGGEETRGGAAPLRLPGVALNCRAWFILLNHSDNRAHRVIPNGRACAADAPAGKRPGAARRPYRPGNGEPCRAGVSGAIIARFRTH